MIPAIGSATVTEEWGVPAWLAVLAVVAVSTLLVVTLRVARDLAVQRGVLADLRDAVERRALQQAETADRLARVERRLARLQSESGEYVITGVGDPAEHLDTAAGSAVDLDLEPERTGQAPMIEAPLFADLVLRESVVQVASLAHGVRRVLAPETRHRIRFEMRREVKRSRRQRRADDRAARRAWEAQQRRETVSP